MWSEGRSRWPSFRRRIHSDGDDPEADVDDYKILILGSSGVGKTALCMALIHGDASQSRPYISDHVSKKRETRVDTRYSYHQNKDCLNYTKWEMVDDKECHLHVIDAQIPEQGDAQGSGIRPLLENVDGVILVYSVTDMKTFSRVTKIYGIIQRLHKRRDCPVVLVGGKMDLKEERVISTEMGREVAFDLGSSFYETSSRLDHSLVTKVFHDVVRQARCVKVRSQQRKKKHSSVKGLFNRLSLKSKTARHRSGHSSVWS